MGQAGPFSWGKFLGRGPAVNCRGHRPEGGAGALQPAPRSPPPRAPLALSLGATGFAWGPGWLLSRGALQGKPVGWGAARFGVRPDRVISLLPRPSGLPSPSPAPLLVCGWHGVSVPLTWGVRAPGLQALFNLRLMHLPSYHQNRAGAPQGSNRGPLAKASPPPPALVIQVSYPSGWWLLGARRPGRPGGRRGSPLKEPPALSPAGRAPALGARPLAHRLQSRGDGRPHWEGRPQPGPACGSQEPRWSPCWGRGARSW